MSSLCTTRSGHRGLLAEAIVVVRVSVPQCGELVIRRGLVKPCSARHRTDVAKKSLNWRFSCTEIYICASHYAQLVPTHCYGMSVGTGVDL